MTLSEYIAKHPLTRGSYPRADVEKIRGHAFLAGKPEVKETRSQAQNRYYWGVVCKLVSDHTGYTPDEVHQIMAGQFLGYERNEIRFIPSTTKLKTGEFEIYMEQCRRWASVELSCYIPLPSEPNHFFYKAQP